MGAVFEVEPSTVDERFSPELSPEEAVETLALRRLLRDSPEFLPDPPPLRNLPSAQSYEPTDSERSSTES